MIIKADNSTYEKMRSREQNLTFDGAAEAFKQSIIEFSEDKYINLGLRDLCRDEYTNLAHLISDQCRHTVKAAVFSDIDNITFNDAKEFKGSIFKQLNEAFTYISMCNKKTASFDGLKRSEKFDYPEEALREALINALMHRDYSFSGSIIININNKSIEFISIGGLLPGLSAEDIRSGISQPRNPNLANIFHRLKLAESYGTGIRRIFALYENCAAQPVIKVTPNTFKLILPNMNAPQQTAATAPDQPAKKPAPTTPQMKLIMDYLNEYGKINNEGAQELLSIKRTRAYVILKQMEEAGLLTSQGRGPEKIYKLA